MSRHRHRHYALTQHDCTVSGWDRYKLAGVDVYDFSSDPPTPFFKCE